MIRSHELSASPAEWDLDLVRRYAVPGPRYTSYPPANKFHTDLTAVDLEQAIADDNRPGAGPISLYLHLPLCESRCWYCGCTTIVTRRRDWAYTYLDILEREIALVAARIDRRRPVVQLHFGGGTPTFFPPDALARLGQTLRRHFTFAADAEISVEIDPRRVTREHIDVLRALGVNRASLGIQDTDLAVQRAINRVQPQSDNLRVVDWLRQAGITAINLDLIYGLPRQTPASVRQTVADALALRPDRLSVFSYAHVPWIKPAQRIFEQRDQLLGPEQKLQLFAVIRQELLEEGFIDVGLDHFARPDDELAQAHRDGNLHRNFQGYSTRPGASLYGFGLSAISATPDVYWQSPKSLADYRAAIAAGQLPAERGYRLTAEDQRRRRIIMAIMCRRRLDFDELSAEFGFDFALSYFDCLQALAPMLLDHLLTLDESGLQVLPRGEPLLRVIAMAFDETYQLSPTVRAHASTV